jgi:lysophospholipase L1-like esterase
MQAALKIYRSASIIVLNLLLLLLAANAVAWGIERTLLATNSRASDVANVRNPWLAYYGYEKVSRLIPDFDAAELNRFLNLTWVAGQHYAPFIQIQSKAVTSKYLNIDRAGFRSIGATQAAWPPDPQAYNIFVFGGSTTFGVAVSDEQTVAAYLQALLRSRARQSTVNVYNFGTWSHFSTQERLYLDQLLLNGRRPDLAIFIDGLNDTFNWHGVPSHTAWYEKASEMNWDINWRRDAEYYARELLLTLPLTRVIRQLLPSGSVADYDISRLWFWLGNIPEEDARDPARIRELIDRYEGNVRLARSAAALYGTEVLFVWQPVPFYKYPRLPQLYDLLGEYIGGHRRSYYSYPAMKERLAQTGVPADFVWCADIQENADADLYVDHVHYNPRMGKMLAECISDGLSKLPPPRGRKIAFTHD